MREKLHFFFGSQIYMPHLIPQCVFLDTKRRQNGGEKIPLIIVLVPFDLTESL